MRFLSSSLLLITNFISLSFPIGTLGNSEVQANHGISDVPGDSLDRIQAKSSASSLRSSYILENVQDALFSLDLDVMGEIQHEAFADSDLSPVDFWDIAKKYEQVLQDYVPRLLKSADAYFKSTKFTDITIAMDHIVSVTATFRDSIEGGIEARQITFETLTEELEGIFMAIASELKKTPPPNKAPGHTERAEMVERVMDDAEQALVNLVARHGIEQEAITSYLSALKPHIHALIVIVGDINEQHPKLLPILAFSVAALLIPESWILRPFLSLFGFGPTGPMKGSAAAWLQSRLWGATVEAGSWFSLLQKAGMGVIPKWAGFIGKGTLLLGGLIAILLSPCFKRRA
ncbi:hypothetical protein JVU11DRAFT_11690 [Chiua virens]|nr:hypothetical protein JVU11DRAFT_11690 [Chiua virens]